MGFASYNYKGKSYWMSEGNVRSCEFIQGEIDAKKKDPKVLEDFLARNATYDAAPPEQNFGSTQQPAPTAESVKADSVVPTEPAVEEPVSAPEPEAKDKK